MLKKESRYDTRLRILFYIVEMLYFSQLADVEMLAARSSHDVVHINNKREIKNPKYYNAIFLKKRKISWFFWRRSQFSQVVLLSWL